MLEEENKLESEEWFEKIDERVFSFKHRVHNWLNDAEIEEAKSATHSSRKGARARTSKSRSGSSRSSSSHSSCKLKSMKERALYFGDRILIN